MEVKTRYFFVWVILFFSNLIGMKNITNVLSICFCVCFGLTHLIAKNLGRCRWVNILPKGAFTQNKPKNAYCEKKSSSKQAYQFLKKNIYQNKHQIVLSVFFLYKPSLLMYFYDKQKLRLGCFLSFLYEIYRWRGLRGNVKRQTLDSILKD